MDSSRKPGEGAAVEAPQPGIPPVDVTSIQRLLEISPAERIHLLVAEAGNLAKLDRRFAELRRRSRR